ncbi:MAG: hypothetical protein JO177_06830 [Candidatus Eremiobacteraeota bacterium]|nr:hypothetical protein [Candidatus Eremiobacteraeota bacterium]
MYYVEMLRAWRVMRIFLIILGILFVLAIVGRFSGHGRMDVANQYVVPPNARHVVHSVAPDGSRMTSFDGSNGEHVVIRTDPTSDVQSVAVTEPVSGKTRPAEAKIANVSIKQSRHGHLMTTVLRYHRIPLDYALGIAAIFVAIFSSILGLGLSQENDGHLELAWTKPTSRQGYAASLIGVDILAMVALLGITVALIVVILAMYGLAKLIVADAGTLLTLFFAFAYIVSFYALVMAITASLRRASAVALAILWPVVLILPSLTEVKWLNIGAIVRFIDTINPLAYFYSLSSSSSHTLLPPGIGYSIGAMAVVAVVGFIASLAQWRRLEA